MAPHRCSSDMVSETLKCYDVEGLFGGRDEVIEPSLIKTRALDVLQGVRSLSFRSDKSKSIRCRKNKQDFAEWVYLADSFAHDLIDDLLLFSLDKEPTVSRFVLLHSCNQESESAMPLIDNYSIKAPCCKSELYEFPESDSITLSALNLSLLSKSRTGSHSFSNSLDNETFPRLVTSTPKSKLAIDRNQMNFHKKQEKLQLHFNSASSGSTSLSAAEHYETPLSNKTCGNRERTSTSPRKYNKTQKQRRQHSESSDYSSESENQQNKLCQDTRRRRPCSRLSEPNHYRETKQYSLMYENRRGSYDKYLFIETNYVLKKQKDDVDSLGSPSEKKKDNNNTTLSHISHNSSPQSVIRHPSYFSDDSCAAAADEADTENVRKSNETTQSDEYVPVFDCEINGDESNRSSIDNTSMSVKKNIETQTDISYLNDHSIAGRSSISPKMDVLSLDRKCTKCIKNMEKKLDVSTKTLNTVISEESMAVSVQNRTAIVAN